MKYAVMHTDKDGNETYMAHPSSYSVEFSKCVPRFYWTQVPNWVEQKVADKYVRHLRDNPMSTTGGIRLDKQEESTLAHITSND